MLLVERKDVFSKDGPPSLFVFKINVCVCVRINSSKIICVRSIDLCLSRSKKHKVLYIVVFNMIFLNSYTFVMFVTANQYSGW